MQIKVRKQGGERNVKNDEKTRGTRFCIVKNKQNEQWGSEKRVKRDTKRIRPDENIVKHNENATVERRVGIHRLADPLFFTMFPSGPVVFVLRFTHFSLLHASFSLFFTMQNRVPLVLLRFLHRIRSSARVL